jgi:uncharacterized iron-regulated membrane protein
VRILVPEGQRQPITVVVAHGNAPLDRQTRTSQLTVDSQTGDVLAIDDYRQRRLGDDVVAWIGPLHSGHFGGMTVRIVWAIAGLAFPALFVTGFLMWNNRVLAPWLRRRGSTARDATPGL